VLVLQLVSHAPKTFEYRQMLTRDLFAVANLLVLYRYVTVGNYLREILLTETRNLQTLSLTRYHRSLMTDNVGKRTANDGEHKRPG